MKSRTPSPKTFDDSYLSISFMRLSSVTDPEISMHTTVKPPLWMFPHISSETSWDNFFNFRRSFASIFRKRKLSHLVFIFACSCKLNGFVVLSTPYASFALDANWWVVLPTWQPISILSRHGRAVLCVGGRRNDDFFEAGLHQIRILPYVVVLDKSLNGLSVIRNMLSHTNSGTFPSFVKLQMIVPSMRLAFFRSSHHSFQFVEHMHLVVSMDEGRCCCWWMIGDPMNVWTWTYIVW